jgi:hypothetical protein
VKSANLLWKINRNDEDGTDYNFGSNSFQPPAQPRGKARALYAESGTASSSSRRISALRFYFRMFRNRMSHLGSRILYHALNSVEGVACERAFAPWPDMEQVLREEHMPLFSLETKRPLKEFDIVGFALLYEMCYTNILQMLDLSGIPLLAKDRGKTTR